jgi:hypothetical protein
MVQQIVYTDEREDKIVDKFSVRWNISKAETIKKMIRDFKEDVKDGKQN